MPLYEYVCQDCGTHFDLLRPIKDADRPAECEVCHSDHSSRQLSLFNAQSEGRAVAGTGGDCAGCAGGSCASCGHR